MGKAPAFQFYVRDWLSDPQLRQASLASRAIWIDCLCFMWESKNRGMLTGTVASLSRMLGVSEADFEQFIAEANVLEFANVTLRDSKVTLGNRRMMREEKDKESHRKRQHTYRSKKSDATCDAKVTPLSSSSSSSSFLNTEIKESTKENVTQKNGDERPRKVRSAHPSFSEKDFETVTVETNVPESIRQIQAERRGIKSPRAAPFVPPTADEVAEYCTERGNNVNPQVFCDFYAAKGWKIGNSPMRNWQAAVRTWEVRGAERMPQQTLRTPARASPERPMTLREAQFWDREQIAMENIRKREAEENAKNGAGNNQGLGHEVPELRLLAGPKG